MKNSHRELLTAAGLALIAFGVYLSLLSKAYVFEGLIRAMPIETGDWGYLFPGNYLLYGPLGLIFHTFLHLFSQPLAVTSLQILDAVLGAGGLFVFYFLLRRLGGERWESLIWSMILGSCQAYWLWSTEAEDYLLSTVLLLILFYALVRSRDREIDPVLLGGLHGLAILGHIVNVMFAPVVLWYLLRKERRRNWTPVLRYLAGTAVVVCGAYAGILVWIRKPATFQEGWAWFLGSAKIGQGTMNWGSGYSREAVGTWLAMTWRIILPLSPTNYRTPAAWPGAEAFLDAAGLLLVVLLGVLAMHLRSIYRRNPDVVGACGVWLAMYALVFIRWQPYTMVYRVSDLVPICVLLFLGYRDFKRDHPWVRDAALAFAIALFIGNGSAELWPRSLASNNPHLARMAFLKSHTPEDAWITGDSGQDEIYIPYFAQRRPIVLARFSDHPEGLDRWTQVGLAKGEKLFVTSRVLALPDWKQFYERYRLDLIAQEGNDAVYRVRKKRV